MSLQRFTWMLLIAFVISIQAQALDAQGQARDPGVRGGDSGSGGPIDGLSAAQIEYFNAGRNEFVQVDSVTGTLPQTSAGLGPRFNADSCGACHAHPDKGGSGPPQNQQIAIASKEGATNAIPAFLKPDGPTVEVRFRFNADGTRDGGVHALFTIRGRSDAKGCEIDQPDFEAAAAKGNLVFRIPTPLFGAGLIEAIPDRTILANAQTASDQKRKLGISGRPNLSGNDGTVTRFGWKAQNKSLLMFSGEAYNVEQGISNELFPSDRDETPGCTMNATPEDETNLAAAKPGDVASDIVLLTYFVRMLAPPKPAAGTDSTARGRSTFDTLGCALCHTPSLTAGASPLAALGNQQANLFSDLLVHKMGPKLADNIVQGGAGPDEFRTAPLWGLGQRVFFLHDGRTKDLMEAIRDHASAAGSGFAASEANQVIARFDALPSRSQQDLLNFLRSL